ncbi:MAG: hypothetical protein ACU841_01560 [Gammaproteobacteria bacterium]
MRPKEKDDGRSSERKSGNEFRFMDRRFLRLPGKWEKVRLDEQEKSRLGLLLDQFGMDSVIMRVETVLSPSIVSLSAIHENTQASL